MLDEVLVNNVTPSAQSHWNRVVAAVRREEDVKPMSYDYRYCEKKAEYRPRVQVLDGCYARLIGLALF